MIKGREEICIDSETKTKKKNHQSQGTCAPKKARKLNRTIKKGEVAIKPGAQKLKRIKEYS
jgi:hypothetical protein